MSCRIYEESDDTYRIEIEGEQIADDLDEEGLADQIAELLESGDLEPEEVVTHVEWDGSVRRRRVIALLTPAQRRSLGYVISAQAVNGDTQSDLDED